MMPDYRKCWCRPGWEVIDLDEGEVLAVVSTEEEAEAYCQRVDSCDHPPEGVMDELAGEL